MARMTAPSLLTALIRALSGPSERVRDVFRHSWTYLAGEAAATVLVVISTAVFSRLLTPSGYGLYQVFLSFAALLPVIFTLNFHGSVSRYHYEETADVGSFLGVSLLGSFGIFLLASLLLWPQREIAAAFVGLPTPIAGVLFLYIAATIPYAVLGQILVARKQSTSYVRWTLWRGYQGFILGCLFTLYLAGERYTGPILGVLASTAIVAVFASLRLARELRWGLKWSHVRFILAYSVPLVPYTLSLLLLGQIDRVMINKMLGASPAGLYSLAYNIAMLLGLITAALQRALLPDWFRLMHAGDYATVDAIVDRVWRLTVLVAAAIVLFSGELITIIADARYHQAAFVIPIVVAGYAFEGLFKVYGRNIGYTNKMVYVAAIGLTAGAVNVALNWWLLPVYGYAAAAYTTLASYFVMFALAWATAAFVLKTRLTPFRVLLKPLLVFFGVWASHFALASLPWSWNFPMRMLVLVAAALILFRYLAAPEEAARADSR